MTQTETKPCYSPKRMPEGHAPAGCKTLHIVVKEQVFNYAKAQALLSGMRFPEYVAQLMAEAKPVNPTDYLNTAS